MKSMRIHIVCQLAVVVVLTTVFCLGSIVSPSVANATVYYVTTDGNDANPGGNSQPFRTIKQGVSVLKPGDTLYIRQGTYNEAINPAVMHIPSGTSWSNAVKIAGYPGEAVSLNSITVQDNLDNSVVSYVIFDLLTFPAFYAGGNTHHVRLTNSDITGNPGYNNISNAVTTSYLEFIGNRVHDAPVAFDNGMTTGHYGFYIGGHHNLLDRNIIYNNSGYAIHIFHSGRNDVSDNIVRNNVMYGNAFDDGARNQGLGVLILASGANNQAYNNIIYNNATLHGGAAISVAYTNGQTNNQIYNNTIYGNAGAGIEINTSAPGTVVRNNIVYNNGNTIVDWGATGTIQLNNLTTNPQFVNASANDFSLQAGSPAIDAGAMVSTVATDIKGTARPQGATYDIGAYEYGKGPTPLSAPSNFRLVSR
jgi:parallel beta-helix repeat protein